MLMQSFHANDGFIDKGTSWLIMANPTVQLALNGDSTSRTSGAFIVWTTYLFPEQ